MMLTGRNEWIAIAALILYIAFVPCPYEMKQFFASPIGKVVALAAVVYAWKYVSSPVAILLLVAFLRSGSMREYLEGETGMTPPPATSTDYKCPDEFIYAADKKMCTKGTEVRAPECNDSSMMWDSSKGSCVPKTPTPPPSTSSGGPPGGTTPGAMAAKNELANSMPPVPPISESFESYAGKDKNFASV
jgi:hypothetical protein